MAPQPQRFNEAFFVWADRYHRWVLAPGDDGPYSPWFLRWMKWLAIVAVVCAGGRYLSSGSRSANAARRLIAAEDYEALSDFMTRLQSGGTLSHELLEVVDRSPGFANYVARRWADHGGRDLPGWTHRVVLDGVCKGFVDRPTLARLAAIAPPHRPTGSNRPGAVSHGAP